MRLSEFARVGRSGLLMLLLPMAGASAGEPGAPLPEPLTLSAALSLADAAHPDVALVAADNAARRADQLAVEALTGTRARFAPDDEADGLLIVHARQHRRTKILRCYLSVLLADLAFALQSEATAIAYVRMDRARQRYALGQVSDIALAERASHYQSMRRKRYAAESAQRASRSRLALALNRPGELASVLIAPRLPGNEATRTALEQLETRALARNTRLRALRLRMGAAHQRLEAARAAASSTPRGDGQDSGATLSPARLLKVAVSRYQAQLAQVQGQLDKTQLGVRQAILDAWLELETLYVAREEDTGYADYRDLYLDLSRALYEQEINADLGDAMVKTSEARLRSARTEFAIARTWARIGLLTGVSPEDMSADILGTEP